MTEKQEKIMTFAHQHTSAHNIINLRVSKVHASWTTWDSSLLCMTLSQSVYQMTRVDPMIYGMHAYQFPSCVTGVAIELPPSSIMGEKGRGGREGGRERGEERERDRQRCASIHSNLNRLGSGRGRGRERRRMKGGKDTKTDYVYKKQRQTMCTCTYITLSTPLKALVSPGKLNQLYSCARSNFPPSMTSVDLRPYAT